MNIRRTLGLAALTIPMLGNAHADVVDISQTVGTAFSAYFAGYSLAQTFTAGITMQLDRIQVVTDSWSGTGHMPIDVSLYRITDAGSPLGQALGTTSLPTGLGNSSPFGWADIDLRSLGIVLERGQQYSVVFSSSYDGNTDFANGLGFSATGNVLPDGALWEFENGAWKLEADWINNEVSGISDLEFITSGTPVPLPGSLLLLLSGGAGILAARRKRIPAPA